jgi:hypothetical protein
LELPETVSTNAKIASCQNNKLKEESKRAKTVIVEKSPSVLSVSILCEESKCLRVEVSSRNCIAKDLIKQVRFLLILQFLLINFLFRIIRH